MLTAIFQTVLKLSLAGSLVAAAILLVRALFGRRIPAHIQYALWALLLIRLALPVLPASPISIFSLSRPAQTAMQSRIPATAPSSSTVSGNTEKEPAGSNSNTGPESSHSSPSPSAFSASVAAAGQNGDRTASFPAIGWNTETASLFWLLGMAVVLLYLSAVNLAVRFRLSRWTICRDGKIAELLEGCKERIGLRAPVRVLFSAKTTSPAVFGLFRPRILLSGGLVERSDENELRYILFHELTHVKRRDNAVSLIVLMLEAVNWFNPILLYAFHKMREDCEISCDASVLTALGDGERRAYGYSILNMLQSAPPHFAPGAVGFAGGFTKRRIIMIAKGKKTSMSLVALALVIVLLAGCTSLPGKMKESSRLTVDSSASSLSASSMGAAVRSSSSSSAQPSSESSISSSTAEAVSSSSALSASSGSAEEVRQQALEMTDKQWEDMLGGLDLFVADYDPKTHESIGLTFSKSTDISSKTLFTFFCYITEGASGFEYEFPKNYNQIWYQKDGQYQLPLATVEGILNQYFGSIRFDPSQIDGYDSKTQCFTKMIDGFGGANAPVLAKKEVLPDSDLRITINYYDVSAYYGKPSKKIFLDTKAYTIHYSDNRFQFVSIIKQ